MNKASINQPDPLSGDIAILPLVLSDLQARSDTGKIKYGTRLYSNNGRAALWDAYQEALDLVMYLRQAIAEKEKIMNTESNKIILEQKIKSTKDLLQIMLKRRILNDKKIMKTKAHLYDMEKKLKEICKKVTDG